MIKKYLPIMTRDREEKNETVYRMSLLIINERFS